MLPRVELGRQRELVSKESMEVGVTGEVVKGARGHVPQEIEFAGDVGHIHHARSVRACCQGKVAQETLRDGRS